MSTPLVITGHDVLGVILRRNLRRPITIRQFIESECAATRVWGSDGRIHVARLSEKETVESNLPLP